MLLTSGKLVQRKLIDIESDMRARCATSASRLVSSV
jgi:hypothetical protein